MVCTLSIGVFLVTGPLEWLVEFSSYPLIRPFPKEVAMQFGGTVKINWNLIQQKKNWSHEGTIFYKNISVVVLVCITINTFYFTRRFPYVKKKKLFLCCLFSVHGSHVRGLGWGRPCHPSLVHRIKKIPNTRFNKIDHYD